MPASVTARRIADARDAERRRLEDIGVDALERILGPVPSVVREAYRRQAEPAIALAEALAERLMPTVLEAMLASRVYGMSAVVERAAQRLSRPRIFALPPPAGYAGAIGFIQQRMNLSAEDIERIRSQYGRVAEEVVVESCVHATAGVRAAVNQAIADGVHVREGMKRVGAAFEASGYHPKNPYLAETIFRTQMQVAYSAGRDAAYQSAAINDILWGFEYVTVGDDRVRPNHAALDGFRAPKDDPRWNTLMAPNGWNCRCDVIEVFIGDSEATPVEVDAEQDIDGVIGRPVPDEGWEWRASKVIGTGPAPKPPVRITPPKPPTPPVVRKPSPKPKPITPVPSKPPPKPIDPSVEMSTMRKLDTWTEGDDLVAKLAGDINDPSEQLTRQIDELKAVAKAKSDEVQRLYRAGLPANDAAMEIATNWKEIKKLERQRAKLRRRAKDDLFGAIREPESRRVEFARMTMDSSLSKYNTRRTVDSAEEFVSSITRAPGRRFGYELHSARLGRASCSSDGMRISLSPHGKTQTAVHELGHLIEDRMPGAHRAARDFLKHRVGDEKPSSLAKLFPRNSYRADEMGRRDDFERAFSKTDRWRAYYAGKVCSTGNTELVSMGLEELFRNPVRLARNDPEYCKFLLAVVKGVFG